MMSMEEERSGGAAAALEQSQIGVAPLEPEQTKQASDEMQQLVPFVSLKDKKAAYFRGLLDGVEADPYSLSATCLSVAKESVEHENQQVIFKLMDGFVEVGTAVDAGQPVRDTMALQRKQEILTWLRQRLHAGLISKQELQSRIEQIEANLDKLMSPEEARQFTMSMGIMQVEDAEVTSPNTDKDKAKNLEENKKAKELIKKFAAEKKEREKRQLQQRRLVSQRFAEQDKLMNDTLHQKIEKAKAERLSQLRGNEGIESNEYRANYRLPFAQRKGRQLTLTPQQEQHQENLAESGSVGQQSDEAPPTSNEFRSPNMHRRQNGINPQSQNASISNQISKVLNAHPQTPSGGVKSGHSRQKNSNHQGKHMKTVPNRTPLFQQMAQKDQEMQQFTLELKKKRLEEIRAFHKPLDQQDMMNHAVKYEQIRQAKGQEVRQKRKAEVLAERMRRELLPTFNSVRNSTDQADGLEVLRKPGQLLGIEREKELQAERKRKQTEKIHNYGKYVKEMYWPKVSEKNQSQMARLKEKVLQQNTSAARLKSRKPSYAPGDRPWQGGDQINKSQSQAHLPSKKIDVRSQVSQESIAERDEDQPQQDDGESRHFKRRKLKSTVIIYPSTDKKQESNDHQNVKNYLQHQRNKKQSKPRQGGAGYVSNFTNYEDIQSDSAQSYMTRQQRPVADLGLRKLLNDPNISETERMNGVKIRTEQIEERAKMEEQKMRLMRPPGGGGGGTFETIDQSIAVNDIYIDSIQAKLKILERI